MRKYKLMKELPFLKKGSLFMFEDETSLVYWYDQSKKKWSEYPLRQGLSGYLWLLLTERGYLRAIK